MQIGKASTYIKRPAMHTSRFVSNKVYGISPSRTNVGEHTKRASQQEVNDAKEARMDMRLPLLMYWEKLHPAMRSVENNDGICRL
ncbi:hypothetical protein JTE90_018176 [Oedothorax gibbosus]|uniref:Uncharacterized protein n=1 Tax=Oedothorax gibbosus TaxID=931172 RepID=A0AAV6UBE0_9ARAC|nr:hypothetical protein JTE90_018176 [Oedothorax gibbosus]